MKTLIFTQSYPLEVSQKLMGDVPVVVSYYALGFSTEMRMNVRDGAHEVVHVQHFPKILSKTQCNDHFQKILREDEEFCNYYSEKGCFSSCDVDNCICKFDK